MDNKEVIAKLKEVKSTFETFNHDNQMVEDIEAIDIAIKSLEDQQSTIEELKEIIAKTDIVFDEYEKKRLYDGVLTGILLVRDIVRKRIYKLTGEDEYDIL